MKSLFSLFCAIFVSCSFAVNTSYPDSSTIGLGTADPKITWTNPVSDSGLTLSPKPSAISFVEDGKTILKIDPDGTCWHNGKKIMQKKEIFLLMERFLNHHCCACEEKK